MEVTETELWLWNYKKDPSMIWHNFNFYLIGIFCKSQKVAR